MKLKLFLSLLLLATVGFAQSFTIINPYKGADGTGPYANWYVTSTHTHTTASGSTISAADLFTSAAGVTVGAGGAAMRLVPVNDKGGVTADPGSHPGVLYWSGYEETFANTHIICLGCSTWLGSRTSDQDAVQKINSQGGLAVLAHPTFASNSWNTGNIPAMAGFWGIEVQNGQGFTGWSVWDAALAKGRQIFATGGNDLYSAGYAEVMLINSPSDSYEDLIANLKVGNFYGADICGSIAQGCTPGTIAAALRVTQSGNTFTADFRNSESDSTPITSGITWYCGYPSAGSVCGTGRTYTVTGNEVYIRAAMGSEVYSPYNVWSQPIMVVQNPVKPVVAASTRVSAGAVR